MRCRICHALDAHPTLLAREMMFGTRQTFEYFTCNRCNCLQIVDIPKDLSVNYPSNYYSFTRETTELALKLIVTLRGQTPGPIARIEAPAGDRESARLARAAEYWHATYFAEHSIGRDSKILDVGAGSGSMLKILSYGGFRQLLGIDAFLSEDHRDEATGIVVKKARLADLEPSFDLVMFNHSFEHVPDPLETLRDAGRLLAPGGTILIRIPIVPSYAFERYGVDWCQLDAPRHLYLHSTTSIDHLARACELKVTKTLYDSTYFQFTGSEKIRRDIPLEDRTRDAELAPESTMIEYRRLAVELNQASRGDQAAFYLQRS